MDEIVIKQRQLKEDMVALINNAQLPAFIIKPIIKDLLEQINQIEQQEYEIACNNVKEKEEEAK